MTKQLFNGLCFLTALFIPQLAVAQETLPPYNIEAVLTPSAVVETVEVIPTQPVPVETKDVWMDGRASLTGGLTTTSQQQFEYARRSGLIVVTSSNLQALIASGYLEKIEGPNIRIKSNKVIPYVLPSTKAFVLKLAYDFGRAGCGALVVTSALRLADGPMPKHASPYSVHPTGMAVDSRVSGLSEPCRSWITAYLLNQESAKVVDATEELVSPHFHTVVPPHTETHLALLAKNR